jgi:hypothetical protein
MFAIAGEVLDLSRSVGHEAIVPTVPAGLSSAGGVPIGRPA